MVDKIVVPDETIKKRLEASSHTVEEKSDIHVDMGKVNLGGNTGFKSSRLLMELNRSRGDAIKQELSTGKDDLVFSFSSQPINLLTGFVLLLTNITFFKKRRKSL